MDEMKTDPVDVPEPVLEIGDEDIADGEVRSDHEGPDDADLVIADDPEVSEDTDAETEDREEELADVEDLDVEGETVPADGGVAVSDTDEAVPAVAVPAVAVPAVADTEESVPAVAVGATAIHWLVRIAERAGLEGERPDLPPDAPAVDAWLVVSRNYKVDDERLCDMVAEYFRLDVVDSPHVTRTPSCWFPSRWLASTTSSRSTRPIGTC